MTWQFRNVLQTLRGKRKKSAGVDRDLKAAVVSSRLKSDLLATMSHEIRTPMNAVLGMTDLLRLTELTRKQIGYLQTIQSSGDMLLSLLDNTLDYTRLEAGGIDLQQHEFDVAELLERVLQITGYQAYSKGLELIADFPSGPPLKVVGDIDRLRQILVDLVSSGIRHTDKGEVVLGVTSEANTPGTTLRFSVTDQGLGVSKEFKERILTQYESIAVHEQTEPGSGLGLTICRRLVEHMGGDISVTTVPGKTTTVWFEVPLESIVRQSGESESGESMFENERALIINSSPVAGKVICRNIQHLGLDCAVVTDTSSALAQLDVDGDTNYSVAIIDKDLADDDGLLLARQIRARRATADLPIILLTSIARPLEVGEISRLGNIRCVNKPVLPSELRHNLLRLMRADTEFAADTITTNIEAVATPNHQLRVLIAEDNMVNSRMLLAMLCSLECYPDIVEDGPAALSALARQAYDLVLMDCQMPGLDGDEVVIELRANPGRYRSQPVVIAVTADNSDAHRRRCLEAGMDGFIAKPVRLDKLRIGLEQWPLLLGAPRTSDAGDEAGASDQEDLKANVRNQLSDRAGTNGSEFVRDYIDLFLADTASRLEKMRKALLDENTDKLGRECHALKGTCLEFGVVRMGQYCDSLRAASGQGNLEESSRILTMLDSEYARVRPVFEAEKAASR